MPLIKYVAKCISIDYFLVFKLHRAAHFDSAGHEIDRLLV